MVSLAGSCLKLAMLSFTMYVVWVTQKGERGGESDGARCIVIDIPLAHIRDDRKVGHLHK